jgi:Ser/Thr protein kinase RdoA (MazF antagonist)
MNNEIKVLRSVIDPRTIAEIVSQNYLFYNKLSCKLIKACGSNDIYEIKDGAKKYIVKLYSIRKCWPYTKDHYLFELELQKFLHENNISVPIPIKNLQNSLISELKTPEYKKYYAVYTYLDGKLWNRNTRDNERLTLLGKNLAILHNISKNFQPNMDYKRILDIDFLIDGSYSRIKKFANIGSKKLLNEIHNILTDVQNHVKIIDLAQLDFGIIHGDMHPGNHFYNRRDKTISLFDFELCGYGYHIYDLATFKWGLLRSNSKNKKSNWESFLNGYLSVNKLADVDSLVKFFIQVRQLFFFGSTFILYDETVQFNNFFNFNQEIELYKNMAQEF